MSIWIKATKSYAKKLERVQAMALRIMPGAMPSTLLNVLDHITDTINILTYLSGEVAKGAARLGVY